MKCVCLLLGGDDRRVLIWNVEKALSDISKPWTLKGEHTSNIFCLGFDSENTKVFSGGNYLKNQILYLQYLHNRSVYPSPFSPYTCQGLPDNSKKGGVVLIRLLHNENLKIREYLEKLNYVRKNLFI